jgi:hypothetical protein
MPYLVGEADMHFSVLSNAVWAASFVSSATLLVVMLVRDRWRSFPVLTLWIGFLATRTSVLFFLYLHDSKHWYTLIYLGGLWIDFFLQLGVVVEIARIVLRPTGSWIRDARLRFATGSIVGAAFDALLAWWVIPPTSTVYQLWRIRGNLFTSLVICELFVLMSLTANRLGLGWRNHVMAVGQGLTAWSSVMLVTTALQSFLGTRLLYLPLEDIRSAAYIAAAGWITVQLWRQEPERQPLSPDLQEYILALHKRVEYDLRRLDAGH